MAGVAVDRKTRVAVGCQPLLQMAEILLPFIQMDMLIIRIGDFGVLGTASAQLFPLGVPARYALRVQTLRTRIVTAAAMDALALMAATGQLA